MFPSKIPDINSVLIGVVVIVILYLNIKKINQVFLFLMLLIVNKSGVNWTCGRYSNFTLVSHSYAMVMAKLGAKQKTLHRRILKWPLQTEVLENTELR